MDILVILEDSNGELHRMSKEAIVGAQKIGGSISALAMGIFIFINSLRDIMVTKTASIFFNISPSTLITNEDPKPAPINMPALSCKNLFTESEFFL